MAHEVELKLRIRAQDVARLRRHPAVAAASTDKAVTRKLTSIYYDTPQLSLLDAGISLRVRRMSGNWFQAVKGAGHSLAGLHQRMEWEDIIAHGSPDFSKITESALTRIFDNADLRAALQPIFSTEVRRTEWQLVLADGSQVEMALDQGSMIAGDYREPISEVELELKQGQPASLFQFALALQADIPLWIENVSKAQRGYARYRPQPPAIVRAGSVRLQPGTKAADAFKHIAWSCLGHLQGNQDMVLHGSDIEGVHQMRVALRRLRSALAVFRDVLLQEGRSELLTELSWITNVLGHARDLDVFLSATLPPLLDALPQHPGLIQLQKKALQARQASYQELRAALDSPRYQRLQLQLGAWLENAHWHDGKHQALGLTELAATILQKRHRQLRRHGKLLKEMLPQERHAARIASKKLRYAAEFFTGLYPATKTHAYIRRLAKLQDVLGTLNDIAVTEALIRDLAGERPPRFLDEALSIFVGWNACHARERMAHMSEVWRAYADTPTFWK